MKNKLPYRYIATGGNTSLLSLCALFSLPASQSVDVKPGHGIAPLFSVSWANFHREHETIIGTELTELPRKL